MSEGANAVDGAVKTDWNNPDSIAQALGITDDSAGMQPKTAPAPAVTPEPPKPAETAKEPEKVPEPKKDDIPEGVATKDGKHVLPYEVLADARREAADAKARLAEVEAKQQELQKALDGANSGSVTGIPDIESLKDQVPAELFTALKGMQEQLVSALDQNKKLAQDFQSRQQELQQQEQDRQTAAYHDDLKTTPLLKKLEETKGPLYEQGVAISKRLLSDPSHKPANRAEHLKLVDSELRSLLGLPGDTTATPTAKPLPPLVPPAPGSLSDIPGGTAPATSEAEAFTNMDPLKAVALLARLTPQQQEEHMARTYL